jgi:hypothetical protein
MIETLIVLAVTGILFVSAALMINGRQSRTDFQVGVRNLQQRLQQIINQTASGHYPNNGNFSCAVAGPPLQISAGSTSQGQNQACIFAGTTVVFGGSGSYGSADTYGVYPLAGRRAIGSEDVKTPQEARLTAVASSTANPSAPVVEKVVLPNGLTYVKARRADPGAWTTNPFATAFLSSFGNFQGASGNTGGSQQLNLSTYSNWSSIETDANNINEEAKRGSVQYPIASSGVEYCFNSGGTDQSVIINISAGLSVTTSIKTGVGCP